MQRSLRQSHTGKTGLTYLFMIYPSYGSRVRCICKYNHPGLS